MKKYLSHNGNLLKRGANKFIYRNYTPPQPVIPYVQIGNQIWASENLSIDDGGDGIAIKYDVTSNGVNFGTQYYYTWVAAKRIVENIEGWRIPTNTDFNNLRSYLESQEYTTTAPLRCVNGWTDSPYYGEAVPGTDIFGFNIEPVGSIRSSNPSDNLAAVGEESMLRADDNNDTGRSCNFMYGWSNLQKFTNWVYSWNMPDAYIAVRLIKE